VIPVADKLASLFISSNLMKHSSNTMGFSTPWHTTADSAPFIANTFVILRRVACEQ
jgi:hypothetical protein